MRANALPSAAQHAAVRPLWQPLPGRGGANPAQTSAQAPGPAQLPRPVPSALSCSGRHGSLLVANAVRADQAAPTLSQETLELISRLTNQVDDAHTDILRRSKSGALLQRHVALLHMFSDQCSLTNELAACCTGSAAAAEAGELGDSELKQKVLATVRDVQQGLLERETEVRPLPVLHGTGCSPPLA